MPGLMVHQSPDIIMMTKSHRIDQLGPSWQANTALGCLWQTDLWSEDPVTVALTGGRHLSPLQPQFGKNAARILAILPLIAQIITKLPKWGSFVACMCHSLLLWNLWPRKPLWQNTQFILSSVTRHTVKLWKSFDAINEARFLLKGKRKVSARRSKLCNCPEICVILSHLLSNDLKTEKSSNLCWLLKHKHKELPLMTSKHGRMASDTVRATQVVDRSPRWYLILIHRFRWYAFKKGVV